MRIAVVQHSVRESSEADARALAEAAKVASDRGAAFVVLPEVFSLSDSESPDRELLYTLLDEIPEGQRLIPHVGEEVPSLSFVAEPLPGAEELGRPALLVGDACLIGTEWLSVMGASPDVLVMCPRSESDLQAEAMLELALGFSRSITGLVIVCDPAGAEPGEPGHGGSAIIHLGEVLAEAIGPDDVLIADIDTPPARPEPPEPLPELPTILKQRLANHRGMKVPVDYPADLSDGPGPA